MFHYFSAHLGDEEFVQRHFACRLLTSMAAYGACGSLVDHAVRSMYVWQSNRRTHVVSGKCGVCVNQQYGVDTRREKRNMGRRDCQPPVSSGARNSHSSLTCSLSTNRPTNQSWRFLHTEPSKALQQTMSGCYFSRADKLTLLDLTCSLLTCIALKNMNTLT